MDQVIVAVAAFVAGFVIGNISKLEMRAVVKRVVVWKKSRKK